MKWYNYETSYANKVEALTWYLKRNKIKFEISDASVERTPVWHFEIYTSQTGADKINDWLDDNGYTD